MENPLVRAFVEAGVQAGYRATTDYNGRQQEGFGPMEHTIYRGQRWSAANAYLKPALKRGDCTVINGLVTKVVLEGTQAIGVEYEKEGKRHVIKAHHEVILAASSINSPKLLMLSGIGPAQHLQQHGLPVVVNRPGVGQNLQDHLELYIQMAITKPVSLFKYWNLFSKARIGLQWLLMRDGLGHQISLKAVRLFALTRVWIIQTCSIISCDCSTLRWAGGSRWAWISGSCWPHEKPVARERNPALR